MSHDPELTDVEGQLFALMRDGVITSLTRITFQPQCWRCTVSYMESSTEVQWFESNVSALDAYMKAFSEIMTRRLEGKPVYSNRVMRQRKLLSLD